MKLEKIIIKRVEGKFQDIKTVEEKTIDAAERTLQGWAYTAPDMGYDKCDFTVLWEDGEKYQGTFDLQKKHHLQGVDLRGQMEYFVNWCAENGKVSLEEAEQFVKNYIMEN